jgi:hypothetical protein
MRLAMGETGRETGGVSGVQEPWLGEEVKKK